MHKFPSIEQYRNAIKSVQRRAQFAGVDADNEPIINRGAAMPKLKYRGTTKIHGTNAAIVKDYKDGTLTYQSRERILTLTSDNAGFALAMSAKQTLLNGMIDGMVTWVNPKWDDAPIRVAVFGEWCGGNIQSSVAVSGLPKMFVIFAVKFYYNDESTKTIDVENRKVDYEEYTKWINLESIKHIESPEDGIHNVLKFGHWDIEIDFARPEESQNIMIDITTKVEEECPVGKFFGKSGVGEGVVWACNEEGWRSSDYWFKVKGEKHSASKVKVLAAVDVEAFKALADFVDVAVTEARLEQGLQNLINEQQKPFEMTSMGDFIRWVYNDVVKEETDTIIANQFDPKKLGGPISTKARLWFINKLNTEG